jgi:hypothetical protein
MATVERFARIRGRRILLEDARLEERPAAELTCAPDALGDAARLGYGRPPAPARAAPRRSQSPT